MEFCIYKDIDGFAKKALPYLEADEVKNNLGLGILISLMTANSKADNPPFMAIIENNDGIQMVMLRTPPHNLILIGQHESPVLDYTIDALASACPEIPGVIGAVPLVNQFSAKWARKTGCTVEDEMKQRIYKLEKVNLRPTPSGSLRRAGRSDTPLVTTWVKNFWAEAIGSEMVGDYLKLAKRLITNGSLYIWDDGKPLSMAAATRPTSNGIVVNGVYTPPEHRGQGYATACVQELSKQLLTQYSFCSLYTDLANPTSNSIYMKIGYTPVCDSAVYRFVTERKDI